jgi:hypothetical protein
MPCLDSPGWCVPQLLRRFMVGIMRDGEGLAAIIAACDDTAAPPPGRAIRLACYHGKDQTWDMQGRRGSWLNMWEIDLSMRPRVPWARIRFGMTAEGIGFTTGRQDGRHHGQLYDTGYYTWHTREHPQRVPCRGSRQAHRHDS